MFCVRGSEQVVEMHFTRGTGTLFQPTRWTRTACAADAVVDMLRELDGIDHGWWCPGTFKIGQKRSKDSWVGNGSLAVLDLDTDPKRELTTAEQNVVLESVRFDVLPWCIYAHTTPHGVRVVARISEPVKDAETYQVVVESLAAEMVTILSNTPLHLDPGSREPWRAMFAPGARVDGVARSAGLREVFREEALARRPPVRRRR